MTIKKVSAKELLISIPKFLFITVPFNNSQTIFKHYANMADVSWIQQMRTTHLTH